MMWPEIIIMPRNFGVGFPGIGPNPQINFKNLPTTVADESKRSNIFEFETELSRI